MFRLPIFLFQHYTPNYIAPPATIRPETKRKYFSDKAGHSQQRPIARFSVRRVPIVGRFLHIYTNSEVNVIWPLE